VGQFVVCFSNEELFQLTPTHSTQIVMKGENNQRVVEVVKIDRRGYSSFCFFYLLLMKFSQTDSLLSRRYKLLDKCFERRDSYIDINTNS